MSKNNFVSHFLPFQINTTIFILWIFLQNGCRRPFWMSENHFRSHFWPFVNYFYKMAASGHFGCPKITFGRISGHFRSIRNFFLNFVYKMAAVGHLDVWNSLFDPISCHFRSIQIFFTKWLPVAILDVRKLVSISFLAISELNFFGKFLTKWLLSAILDVQNSLWITFLAILEQYRFFFLFIFFTAGGHFGCPKITFDLISIHFTSINNFFFKFWQNGWRRPFWMSEFNFRSHFWPFQIDTQL